MTTEHVTHPMQFSSLADASAFMFAGRAIITIVSKASGARYTYKINKADDAEMWFVNLLTGPSNIEDYTYVGIVKDGAFKLTAKSRLTLSSPAVAGFGWLMRVLERGEMPHQLEIWHEGRCGRCNRVLTVPESLAAGIGPECAKIKKEKTNDGRE